MFAQNAKARRRKESRGAAPLSDKARDPEAKHPPSPEGATTQRTVGQGAMISF